jgi:CBS domain-containing protein
MLKNPVVVQAGTKLGDAAALLKKKKAASLLVTRDGRLAGIVSLMDIIGHNTEKEDITVDDVMHSPELTIDSDKWITDALEMFRRYNVSHVAVVEREETIGIISADDILHTHRFRG